MRKYTSIVILLIVIAVGLLWRAGQRGEPAPSHENKNLADGDQIAANPDSPQIMRASNADSPRAVGPPSSVNDAALAEKTREFNDQMQADPSYQFKLPLRFYGMVLDEEENPIAEANVRFEWNMVNAAGKLQSGTLATTSDGAGLFSLEGRNGNQLSVAVTKAGYYSVGHNPMSFEYGRPYAENFHAPDLNKPVTFHLHKRGRGTALVTSQSGIRPELDLAVPMDGATVRVDLLLRKAAENGPLEVSQIKPDYKVWQQAAEWSFRMTIPDGGFVEQHDKFAFEAPETGYQPTVQLEMERGQASWSTSLKRDYYIRFGMPPLYGRLHLETSITEKGARLTYAINPDGSRNLEPQ
jgi:hypothetical protein